MAITRETYITSMSQANGICENCGGSLQQYGTPQLAHRIAKTEVNYKKYGSMIIEHPMNLAATCCIGCNSKMNIGNRPGDCLRLIKKIVESELLKYGGE